MLGERRCPSPTRAAFASPLAPKPGSPSATEGRGEGPIAARHGLGPWPGLKGGAAGKLSVGWMEAIARRWGEEARDLKTLHSLWGRGLWVLGSLGSKRKGVNPKEVARGVRLPSGRPLPPT